MDGGDDSSWGQWLGDTLLWWRQWMIGRSTTRTRRQGKGDAFGQVSLGQRVWWSSGRVTRLTDKQWQGLLMGGIVKTMWRVGTHPTAGKEDQWNHTKRVAFGADSGHSGEELTWKRQQHQIYRALMVDSNNWTTTTTQWGFVMMAKNPGDGNSNIVEAPLMVVATTFPVWQMGGKNVDMKGWQWGGGEDKNRSTKVWTCSEYKLMNTNWCNLM